MNARVKFAVATTLFVLCGPGALRSEDPGDREKVFADFHSDAAQYRMTMGSNDALTLRDTPIMNWTNPARNNELGSIFVWEKDGVPVVIGTVFTYVLSGRNSIYRKHAFHSLAQEPVEAKLEGKTVWHPTKPGLQWKPIDGTPAAQSRKRLTQMRSIARRFKLKLTYNPDRVETLRLLPQPLYRYKHADRPNDEGAIFAFAAGTDPEALLLIESHESGEKLVWRFAFARFHFVQLDATLDDQPVWTAAPENDQRQNRRGSVMFQDRIYSTMLVSEDPIE